MTASYQWRHLWSIANLLREYVEVMLMALTTRAISWSVVGVDNTTAYGSIQITPSVAQIVDTADGIVYVQNTLTYPLSAAQSASVICTDNAATNPSAGNWGYNITLQLAPGTPDINVQNVSIPSGGGAYSLATILNAAGL
jgi:hypothetical protein